MTALAHTCLKDSVCTFLSKALGPGLGHSRQEKDPQDRGVAGTDTSAPAAREGVMGEVTGASAKRPMPHPLPQPGQQARAWPWALAEVEWWSHGAFPAPHLLPVPTAALFQGAKEGGPHCSALG